MSTEDRIENVNPEVEAEEVSEEVLSEQRQIRREKLKALQDAGSGGFLRRKNHGFQTYGKGFIHRYSG